MGTTLMLGSFHRRSFLKSDQSHTAAQPPPSRWRDLVGGGLLLATAGLWLVGMTASWRGCPSAVWGWAPAPPRGPGRVPPATPPLPAAFGAGRVGPRRASSFGAPHAV